MNGARSWLLAAVLGSFAAGTGVGLSIARFSDEAAPMTEQEDYVRRLVADHELVCKLAADHGLTASQERSLRLVLQNQVDEEIALFLSAEPNQLPPPTLSRLLWLRNKTTQRIRAILDPQQRERYDRESRPGPIVVPQHGGPPTAEHR